ISLYSRNLFSSTLARIMTQYLFFFFTDPPTIEIYTLSLHDALPICNRILVRRPATAARFSGTVVVELMAQARRFDWALMYGYMRSEEHTSELQSRGHLACRLLLEKKD